MNSYCKTTLQDAQIKKYEQIFTQYYLDANWSSKLEESLLNDSKSIQKINSKVLGLLLKRKIAIKNLILDEVQIVDSTLYYINSNYKLDYRLKVLLYLTLNENNQIFESNAPRSILEFPKNDFVDFLLLSQYYYFSLSHPLYIDRFSITEAVTCFLENSNNSILQYILELQLTYYNNDTVSFKRKRFKKLLSEDQKEKLYCPNCYRIGQIYEILFLVNNDLEINKSIFNLIEDEKLGNQLLGISYYFIGRYYENKGDSDSAVKFYKKKYDLSKKCKDDIGIINAKTRLFSLILKNKNTKYMDSGIYDDLEVILDSGLDFVEEMSMVIDLISAKGYELDNILAIDLPLVETWLMNKEQMDGEENHRQILENIDSNNKKLLYSGYSFLVVFLIGILFLWYKSRVS